MEILERCPSLAFGGSGARRSTVIALSTSAGIATECASRTSAAQARPSPREGGLGAVSRGVEAGEVEGFQSTGRVRGDGGDGVAFGPQLGHPDDVGGSSGEVWSDSLAGFCGLVGVERPPLGTVDPPFGGDVLDGLGPLRRRRVTRGRCRGRGSWRRRRVRVRRRRRKGGRG
jgi:hypothetical protein